MFSWDSGQQLAVRVVVAALHEGSASSRTLIGCLWLDAELAT